MEVPMILNYFKNHKNISNKKMDSFKKDFFRKITWRFLLPYSSFERHAQAMPRHGWRRQREPLPSFGLRSSLFQKHRCCTRQCNKGIEPRGLPPKRSAIFPALLIRCRQTLRHNNRKIYRPAVSEIHLHFQTFLSLRDCNNFCSLDCVFTQFMKVAEIKNFNLKP